MSIVVARVGSYPADSRPSSHPRIVIGISWMDNGRGASAAGRGSRNLRATVSQADAEWVAALVQRLAEAGTAKDVIG